MLGTRVEFRVIPVEGEPYNVTLTLQVAIAFEQEYKLAVAAALSDTPELTHLAWLAWKATQKSGRVVKPFTGWLETEIVDIELLSDDDPK